MSSIEFPSDQEESRQAAGKMERERRRGTTQFQWAVNTEHCTVYMWFESAYPSIADRFLSPFLHFYSLMSDCMYDRRRDERKKRKEKGSRPSFLLLFSRLSLYELRWCSGIREKHSKILSPSPTALCIFPGRQQRKKKSRNMWGKRKLSLRHTSLSHIHMWKNDQRKGRRKCIRLCNERRVHWYSFQVKQGLWLRVGIFMWEERQDTLQTRASSCTSWKSNWEKKRCRWKKNAAPKSMHLKYSAREREMCHHPTTLSSLHPLFFWTRDAWLPACNRNRLSIW